MKRLTALLLLLCLTAALLSGCSSSGTQNKKTQQITRHLPTVTDAMYDPDYWIAKVKAPDDTLLSASDITLINAQIVGDEANGVVELAAYPSALNAVELRRCLNAVSLPTARLYDIDGTEFDETFFDELILSTNAEGVGESNKVSYAIALNNATLRTYPVAAAAYEDPAVPEVDVFQAGQLLVGDPVILLHTSLDQNWYFIQTKTQRGWVRASDLIFMEKGAWVSYIENDKFLIVTAVSITLEENPYAPALSGLTLYMGTKLPLYDDDTVTSALYNRSTAGCYVVKYPTIDRFGYLEYQPLLIPMTADVHIGYLPYTQRNTITQAFKLTGGRMTVNRNAHGRDGAAFAQDLYAVFGLTLPAISDAQAKIISNSTDMTKYTTAEREKHLASLKPGALLYSGDAVFMYLGIDNKKPYVIGAVDEYFYENLRSITNEIVVTGLDIVRKDGTKFIDGLEISLMPGVVKKTEQKETEKGTTTAKFTTTTKGSTTASGRDGTTVKNTTTAKNGTTASGTALTGTTTAATTKK
ncbi:MAG: SH3 domain-containing protein [Eubacteriales bacterium]|jgi:hypothetical protein